MASALPCPVSSSQLHLTGPIGSMDTPSLKRLIHLTSKTPAVLEFLSGGSFSVPFAESSLSIQLFRTGMFQSSVLEPLFRLQAFSSHLNQFRGFKCHLNLLASGIFSFPPDLFSSFSILASASEGGLYVIYQQASLCLLVGCEQW